MAPVTSRLVVQLRFNGTTFDVEIGAFRPHAPHASRLTAYLSSILSVIYVFPLLRRSEKCTRSQLFMYVDDRNILAWGLSFSFGV